MLPYQQQLFALDRVKPRPRVFELLPETKELLSSAFWHYWTREYIVDLFNRSDPTRKMSWSMLKEVLYRFTTFDPNTTVSAHYTRLVTDFDRYRLVVIGHHHTPSWWSWADRKVLQAGCLRDEYVMDHHGTILNMLPKVYVEVLPVAGPRRPIPPRRGRRPRRHRRPRPAIHHRAARQRPRLRPDPRRQRVSSRRRKRKRTRHEIGLPPGTAVYVGEPHAGRGDLTAFVYDARGLREYQHAATDDVHGALASGRVAWLDCDGVHDVPLVTEIGERFGLPPLAVEDILDTSTRPKLDLLENGMVLVALEVLHAEGDPAEVRTELVTLVLGDGFVLSFQEHTGDRFDSVRQRIRGETGRIRSQGCDYLCYALVDAVVDGYFAVLDRLDDRIEAAEAIALDDTDDLAATVYALKADIAAVRRAAGPLREVTARLLRSETPRMGRRMEPYLRDLQDHVMTTLDRADAGRERLTSILELHLAISAHRMNDVMKVLTVVATVFIPLSWVAGVYGMNFDRMPGSHAPHGFAIVMGGMVLVAAIMVGYFRYRRWL